MPPLLCFPPAVIDHSKERPASKLQVAARAAGALAEVSPEQAQLLITPVLREVVEAFANRPWREAGLMLEIQRLLMQLVLQKSSSTVELNLSSVTAYAAHPLPKGAQEGELAEFWADEVGRLRSAHEECYTGSGHCIAVACEEAFAGGTLGKYSTADQSCLPMVGPSGIASLADAYEWDVSPNYARQKVSFSLAKQNCHALGVTKVVKPKRSGSHFKFVFPGKRNWTLSSNDDPVPDAYLSQLTPLTGFPVPLIRQILILGTPPKRKLRFSRYASR